MLANPQVFLNTSRDARMLRTILDGADSGGATPTEDQLRADVADQGVEPLFDGAELERI